MRSIAGTALPHTRNRDGSSTIGVCQPNYSGKWGEGGMEQTRSNWVSSPLAFKALNHRQELERIRLSVPGPQSRTTKPTRRSDIHPQQCDTEQGSTATVSIVDPR